MLLALETCFGKFSIALFDGGVCKAYFASTEETKQAEELIPAIQALLAGAGVAYGALTKIAVCVGPGSFTGLRIGLAAAKGFGLALPVQVIGVSALAAAAAKKGSYPVYLNASRGEAFYQNSASSAPALIPYTGEFDDTPDARDVALASGLHPLAATPLYVRKIDAKLPQVVADHKTMAKMHAACFDKGWVTADFANYDYILESQGFVAYKTVLDETEIKTICVLPASRKQGIASQLLAQLITAQKGKTIFLEVEESNLPAINLYKKHGFTEFGRRKDYYGAGKDAILMRLS
jgi:tRNA threonylcarbamoyl adenosine modification protein YeaZ